MASKPTETKTEEKATETKREKFVRLASSRTGKALDAIAMLGGLTATNNYDYAKEDWTKIFNALEAEMKKLENKVANPASIAETGFSL